MSSCSTDSSSLIFCYIIPVLLVPLCAHPSDEYIATPACFPHQSDIHIWVKELFNLENFEAFTFLVKCISKQNCIILNPFKVNSSGKKVYWHFCILSLKQQHFAYGLTAPDSSYSHNSHRASAFCPMTLSTISLKWNHKQSIS